MDVMLKDLCNDHFTHYNKVGYRQFLNYSYY